MEPSLEIKYPFLTAMHPVHLEYLQDIPLFTPDQFVSILDNVDAEKRDKVMWGNYKALVESMNAMGFPNQEFSYANFRDLCLRLQPGIGVLIIGGIIQLTLHLWLSLGDLTSIEQKKSSVVEFTEHVMADSRDGSDEFVEWLVDNVEHLAERTAENRQYYVFFCHKVLQPLMESRRF